MTELNDSGISFFCGPKPWLFDNSNIGFQNLVSIEHGLEPLGSVMGNTVKHVGTVIYVIVYIV